MTLNHSKSIIPTVHVMPKRKRTDIIVLSEVMSCTTSACFSTFFRSTMVPTLVENSCLLTFFGNTIIMIMIAIQYKGG